MRFFATSFGAGVALRAAGFATFAAAALVFVVVFFLTVFVTAAALAATLEAVFFFAGAPSAFALDAAFESRVVPTMGS